MTISDHYLIHGIRKFKTFKQAPKFIEYRDFKHFNGQNFLWNLASLSTLNLIYSDPNKSWINNGNCTEWSAIWSEIKRVITKSHDREAGVRFVITSLISDQNCTTRSAISTLLHSF